MHRIFRLCALAIISMLLALATVACSSGHPGAQFYYVTQEGIKVPCNPDTNACGNIYYEIYNGNTYFCSSYCVEDNSITPVATTHVVQSPATPSPSAECKPHWVYDQLVDKGIAWEVAVRQENTNNTASSAQEGVVVTNSKTVTVSDSAKLTASTSLEAGVGIDVGVDVSASMTASVKAEINYSVVTTVVVSVGNSITITIPAHETGYAIYGVKVQVVSGHLYDTNQCEGNRSDVGTDVSYVPIAAGWCTWTSDEPDSCPVVSG